MNDAASHTDSLKYRNQTIGKLAENAAYDFLLTRGLKPVARNYRAATGEIDIIMRDSNDIVFIEVRYRKNDHFGDGAESITWKKQNKIYKTALHFLLNNSKLNKCNYRFDVIAMSQLNNQFEIDWIDDAFQPLEM